MHRRFLTSSGVILALWSTSVSGEPRRRFLEDQFQGIATATLQLSGRLARHDAAARTGRILQATWFTRLAADSVEIQPPRCVCSRVSRRVSVCRTRTH